MLEIVLAQPLVVLVTLIGLGALGAGTFSLAAPTWALQIYGISLEQATNKHNSKTISIKAYEPISRSLSIRNLTLGLSILSITAYWQKVADADPEVGKAIQTCLGYIITIGSIAPATDAYGAWTDGSKSLRRPATILHCLRLCAWLAGGLWCLRS